MVVPALGFSLAPSHQCTTVARVLTRGQWTWPLTRGAAAFGGKADVAMWARTVSAYDGSEVCIAAVKTCLFVCGGWERSRDHCRAE